MRPLVRLFIDEVRASANRLVLRRTFDEMGMDQNGVTSAIDRSAAIPAKSGMRNVRPERPREADQCLCAPTVVVPLAA